MTYLRIIFSTIVVIFLLSVEAIAETYYVNSIDGNNSNSGTSQNAAWQTLAKVSSASLQAGDQVLFKRGQSFSGHLQSSENGTQASPILFGSYDSGNPPVLQRITLSGDYYIIENITVDHEKADSDAIRIRGGVGSIFRNLEVRNGGRDGIDVADADGLLIENSLIHHFLNGSFTNQADSHGIVATGTDGITIRNVEIHHVSGDSFQADPNREVGNITDNILIEDCHFWTSPLSADFNQWNAGERPGENAIDTKVAKPNFASAPRIRITLRNIIAHGWKKDAYIGNKAVFNMKEKITAVFDGVTVYDSEIAFRLRGSLGNADTTIRNAVIYNVEKAIRAEDNLANLVIHNTTFGENIDRILQFAGGSANSGSWDLRNNAFTGSKPSQASHPSNLIAPIGDFQNSSQADYHLSSNSTLIDQGDSIASVTIDRDGNPRGTAYDVGAYELATGSGDTLSPKAPTNLRTVP